MQAKRRRRTGNALLAAIPVILAGLLGWAGRTHAPEPRPELGASQQTAYERYAALMRLPGDATARALGWSTAWESGDLEPLVPEMHQDFATQGARRQIRQEVRETIAELREAAQAEGGAEGAENALLALRMGESVKYFDLNTHLVITLEQRQLAGELRTIWPTLSPEKKAELRAKIAQLLARQRPLDRLATLSRAHFVKYRNERGQDALAIEDAQGVFTVASIVTSHDADFVKQAIQRRLVASSDPLLPEFYSDLRTAYVSQHRLEHVLMSLR